MTIYVYQHSDARRLLYSYDSVVAPRINDHIELPVRGGKKIYAVVAVVHQPIVSCVSVYVGDATPTF